MTDLIVRYPGEDYNSYIKRKAYAIRVLEWRLNYGDKSVEKKLSNIKPITISQKEKIDEFWNCFLSSDVRDRFIDYRYYDVFNKVLKGNEELSHYIPDTFFYCFIDEYYSNPQHSNPIDDKNLYDLYFHDVNRPKTIFRKIGRLILDGKYSEITQKEAIEKAKNCGEVVLKIGKYSYGGHGVMFWDSKTNNEEMILGFLNGETNVICQEVIRQHPILKSLNPCSVNTVRMMTLLFDNQVYVLSSVLRMGINGARTDNASSGGIVCGILPKGRLKSVAYDTCANEYLRHPQGAEFDKVIIPNYDECVNFATVLARRFASVTRLISWDIAIDEFGHPLLIEFGVSNGQMDFHQLCNGPILGDLTEEVLKDVFNNSYTLKSIIKSLQ